MDDMAWPAASDSTTSDPAQQESWEDWEDNESEGFKSLFTDARLGSVQEVLRHDLQAVGFDLQQYRAQHGLDQVGTIRLINFIRAAVAAGQDPLPALSGGAQPWRDDACLRPALPDDELLFHDWEEEGEEEEGEAARGGAGQAAAAALPAPSPAGGEVAELRAENEALRAVVESMRTVVLQDQALREMVVEARHEAGASSSGAPAAGAPRQQPGAAAAGPAGRAAQRIDDSYFDSYSTLDIHREMLADKVRTEAYRAALERNPALMRGARVLDVGCGTGILSMFAARGGAAAVVGIDGSEQIAQLAAANVEASGLGASQGGPIAIVGAKVEQLAALPLGGTQQGQKGQQEGQQGQDQQQEDQQQPQQQQVDVVVSEWMGYALLFESMLSSVLHARDRWLRPGGALLPDVAQLWLAAADEGAAGLDFWKDVYGFSMEAVRASLAGEALRRAVVRPVPSRHLLSEPAALHRLDLATMREEDQDFTAPFTLTPGAGPKEVHSLVLWFDTLFSDRFCAEHPVELSTSPCAPHTHWSQTVLLLKQPVVWAPAAVAGATAGAAAAVAITGQLSMCRSTETHRSLDIVLRYAPRYADGRQGEEQVCIYGMGVEG